MLLTDEPSCADDRSDVRRHSYFWRKDNPTLLILLRVSRIVMVCGSDAEFSLPLRHKPRDVNLKIWVNYDTGVRTTRLAPEAMR